MLQYCKFFCFKSYDYLRSKNIAWKTIRQCAQFNRSSNLPRQRQTLKFKKQINFKMLSRERVHAEKDSKD